MERLTIRDEFGNADIIGVDSETLYDGLDGVEFNRVTEALNKLAGYEEMEEQRLLLKLPCKPQTEVFFITNYFSGCRDIYKFIVDRYEVLSCEVDFVLTSKQFKSRISVNISEFGKTVFLTKEEAEAKLKEMNGGE